MRSLTLFVAAVSLIGGCASKDIPHDGLQDPPAPPTPDVCSHFGNKFCGTEKCEVVPDKTDAFVCRCQRNDMYYDATEGTCLFKRTCKTTECTYGVCIEKGVNNARCGCPKVESLSVNCKIRDWFIDECKRKGATAVLNKEWSFGAKCDCGEWAAMDRSKKKCVPTTCLRPDLTCKELCEKNWLEKDNRCCQGWSSADCSAAPPSNTYCSPGSIMAADGKCQDACTANEAKLVCPDGCRKSESSARAYECRCKYNEVVAEDGITCKAAWTAQACSEEQKKTCLPSQTCLVEKDKIICACPRNHQLVNGLCTSRCTENKCHENFTDCDVYMGKQSCSCPWTTRKPGQIYIRECTLKEYYYTVSFTPNISLDANNCNLYEDRVLEAMKTSIGTEVFKVEILNCTQKIKARLIAAKPLSKYLLKKLQTCEHPDGDLCMLYPKLPIKKDTATEIEEENLCDSLLKGQKEAYNGQNECVKFEDFFWFKCAAGFREVDRVTRGRLRRSVCEPGVSCTPDKELECASKGQICVYENEEPKCQCPPGMVTGQGGCSARTTCNSKERRECEDKKRECVYKDQKAECKCPQGTVDDGHGCSDVCSHFGNKFCGTEKCEVVPDKTDAFVCRCQRNDTYYDATEGTCLFKRTCKTTECTYGACIENGVNNARCGCPKVESLSVNCKIRGWFIDECKRKGATAVLNKEWSFGAKCDCGEWAAMDRSKKKCVPTTCLRPDLTCKDLCEKNWLEKDNRCCQGWSSANCSAAPPSNTYCSPGSIMAADGKCQDACSAREAKLVCPDGCRESESSARAYECRCKYNEVVAEDGITCKAAWTAQACSEEQKKTCLPSQTCLVEKDKIICACPRNHQLVNGLCTSRCTENKCHEDFMDCDVYMEKQGCSCPWTTRKTGQIFIMECTLKEYYYTVSFTPNISLDANNCNLYEDRVLEAMKTSIGTEVFKVEILNCTQKIKARLIAAKPLSKYLLKKLQTCEHPDGDLCMLYPKLPIKKDTATEIEEENLCDSLLKGQKEAYNGQNECVKFEDFFWFKCAAGFREVDRVTRGRLRRSVCEPGVSCTPDKELECASKGQICVYENEEPKCQCPPGMVTGQGGCSARTTCNSKERRECEDKKRECVYKDQKAECKCPQGTVDDGHGCSDVCSHFGNKFCGTEKCEVVPDKTDAFVCRCQRNDTYYDAAEGTCLFKRTCKTTECTYGACIENGVNNARCGCLKVESLSVNCKIRDWFIDECKRKGATAVLNKEWSFGAKCDCGEWAAMDRSKKKCVPTTCLRPDLTCKELCEKNWLEKDNRCCQGWSSADCSAAPPSNTYCSPGSIMAADGKCQDACTAKEAKLVCPDGCRKSESSARAYECRCKYNEVVAEDGITCKAAWTAQACSEEQKKTCLPSQTCLVEKDKIICACPRNHQLVNGLCTSRCTENKCHENFTDCDVYMGKQSCSCPWTTRKPGQIYIRECTLNEYYYTVSFTPNISLDANNCNLYERRVLEAMKTSIGTEVFKVEILNCTQKIKARLIAAKPLSKYLLKKLQTCEHPDGDLCMLYPKLPIKKHTATEIEEENLCDSLLKGQEEAYNGQNECVKFEDFFWFKCAAGFREVDRVTRGRLRRSVCEPGVSCTQDKELECASKGQICVYENEEPKCQCPPGMVTGQGGCSARTTCNSKERRECEDKKRECVYKDQKAECKCPQGTVDDGHGCSDVCSHFGNKFCGTEKCEVVPDKTDAFVCRCQRNDTYYDATEGTCLFKRTCKTTECTYGACIENGVNNARCGCPKVESLSVNCKIRGWFIDECKRKGATAVLNKEWSFGAKCDCGEWAAMDRSKKKCVPTTCLRPDLTCKDLCEKNWLEKDNRCCQGWSSANCSAAPPSNTYCSPGSIMAADGKCQDACSAREAKLVCPDGCRESESSARAYECRCKYNEVVAEDGITCKAAWTAQACSEEQKKTCLPSQTCLVEKDKIICACPRNHQLVNGLCTSRCTENKCHEDFMDCDVYMEKQGCSCPWTTRKTGQIFIRDCTLNEYYYTVSFTPNISLDANNCNLYERRVLEAMKTSIGTEVFKVEILNCTQKIKARLIAAKPLSKYLLKKLQTCEHPDGDLCMLYPKLPIKKHTATEIEEENLCESLLKGQKEAYNGQNECVKFEDFFWFKCAAGFREVDRVTRGRLRRSVCEPRTTCNSKERRECEDKQRECVYKDQKAECKCPQGTVDDGHGCSAAVVPESCNEEETNKCRSSGQRCVMENQKAVCKEASNTPATEVVDPAPSQCDEEMRKKCTKKGAECVTVDGKAICKCPEGKVDTSQGCSDPGPSSAVSVSSTTLLLLAAMTAAAAAAA
ncbi:uncharacterized protein LOC142582545 isoform X2 [Dermacentor variabilis]|uniref:uncharacterized protein LOC142582545 isoform X2 n=1 Tax=Dermacentor variabilis TaxID=34621 RepID=UPI003F5B6B9D